jgi:hypothetical protein
MMPTILSRALRLEDEWGPEVLSFGVMCAVFYAYRQGNTSPLPGAGLPFASEPAMMSAHETQFVF